MDKMLKYWENVRKLFEENLGAIEKIWVNYVLNWFEYVPYILCLVI